MAEQAKQGTTDIAQTVIKIYYHFLTYGDGFVKICGSSRPSESGPTFWNL